MPTDNPKVSGYVPQAIYDCLIKFKDEKGISISQAVTVVLAEYFGIKTEVDAPVAVGGVTLARLEALEKQVAQLLSHQEMSAHDLPSGLPRKTRIELAKHLGLAPNTISGSKNSRTSSDFLEWSRAKDPDGRGWTFLKEENLYEQEPRSTRDLQGGLPLE